MTNEIRTRLLGAIEADSLVFLCGAGLSMSAPSYLPSAAAVANECFDTWLPNETLPPALRGDVDLLAGHFHARGDFESIFINRLVPWDKLAGVPNLGHIAIADLLMSRAAYAALSANFDPLIENWAFEKKVAMRGALTGIEARDFMRDSSPLIKFHGCMQRNRETTVWTKAQMNEQEIQNRIQTCSQWIALNLPGKHLVVTGFWTDWGYLNDVLATALAIRNAGSVTVVNPDSSQVLRAKAPVLWDTLTQMSGHFEHIETSADTFLNELRTAFSESWVRKFELRGQRAAAQSGAPTGIALNAAGAPVAQPTDVDDLYDLRRDIEGTSYSSAARMKEPPASATQVALVRQQLVDAGAMPERSWLRLSGRSIRVVNGGGRTLSEVRTLYREPPGTRQPDVTICAGADDLQVPVNLIRDGQNHSVVRPKGGTGSEWMTTEQAREGGIL